MEKFRSNPEIPRHLSAEASAQAGEPVPEPEMVYRALDRRKEKDVLATFTPEQQAEIKQRQQILSSLAYFIGKDFRIPVELNEAGAGWHWDFEKNIIRIDPKTLLERPMDELRYLMCHEGGHRRVSRTDFIPLEEWRQPGFSGMMNFIEDPRNDNFIEESYPTYGENINVAWGNFFAEEKQKMENMAMQKLGTKPKFMQAGYEYIRHWFSERKGGKVEIAENLPEDVKAAVRATLDSARDSWLRYPSRQEADKGGKIDRKKVDGETMIREYAKTSYEINRDEVWPEFKKLVESDMEVQKTQELLKDMQQSREQDQESGEDSGQGLPQDLKDKLTPEEQKTLEDAINKAIEDAKKEQEETETTQRANHEGNSESGEEQEEAQEGKGSKTGKPVSLDSLPQELKQKIKEYIESLPEDQQREIAEKAQAAFKEFEEALNEELQGKLSDNPEKKAERDSAVPREEFAAEKQKVVERELPPGVDPEELRKYKERIAQEVKKDANVYETMRQEVLPLIDKLETELREIFVARKARSWKSGFTTGKRIDIKRRIQEKAKSVPAMESKAWQKRELPDEKDYAISLLVDLSGSMADEQKIEETFKAVIVLSEVLNRLSINLEILGFNDRIYEYQNFGEQMSKLIREHMGGMLQEVHDKSDTGKARWNDDGWALERASERLTKQKADQKFLVVLSDGTPKESSMHPRGKYELGKMIKKVLEETDQRLIGLGIGRGTEHVGSYYPNSIANVKVKEMAEKLADLIKEVIANYDKF